MYTRNSWNFSPVPQGEGLTLPRLQNFCAVLLCLASQHSVRCCFPQLLRFFSSLPSSEWSRCSCVVQLGWFVTVYLPFWIPPTFADYLVFSITSLSGLPHSLSPSTWRQLHTSFVCLEPLENDNLKQIYFWWLESTQEFSRVSVTIPDKNFSRCSAHTAVTYVSWCSFTLILGQQQM